MRVLFIIIIGALLTGCSASNLLKRSEELERRAIAKGAKVKLDTVWRTRPIVIKGPTGSVPLNIVLNPTFKGKDVVKDTTIYVNKIKIQFKDKLITAECPDSTFTQTYPVTIHKTISAGYSWWQLVLAGLFGAVVGALMAKMLWK